MNETNNVYELISKNSSFCRNADLIFVVIKYQRVGQIYGLAKNGIIIERLLDIKYYFFAVLFDY
jgi:hypothetical protein